MLTITPVATVFGLASYDPSRWGGEISIQNILFMAMFGLITVQVWITYIPSLVLTPIIMKKLSLKEKFYTVPLWKFYFLSVIGGILAGTFILLPITLIAATDSLDITLNWLWAGMVGGTITYPIIASIYRFLGKEKVTQNQQEESPNNGVNQTA